MSRSRRLPSWVSLTGRSRETTYWKANAYTSHRVQLVFTARARLVGVTERGFPVMNTAWSAAALLRQPVQLLARASARLVGPTERPRTAVASTRARALKAPSVVVRTLTMLLDRPPCASLLDRPPCASAGRADSPDTSVAMATAAAASRRSRVPLLIRIIVDLSLVLIIGEVTPQGINCHLEHQGFPGHR